MLILTGLLAAASLLAIFRAPALPFWYIAIAVTEWGHYGAIACLALAGAHRVKSKRWTTAALISALSALIYLNPPLQATLLGRGLPARLVSTFGPITPRQSDAAPARLSPFSWAGLFRAAPAPAVEMMTLTYPAGDNSSLSFDLYRLVDRNVPLPGVVIVHGGSWKSGDRRQFVELSRYLAARGYIVASIDYRLAPKATFPAQRDDLFAAILFLKSHAKMLGLDRDRLALIGRSAGGQIALSAAYAQDEPAIKGVAVFYAPNDLIWGYANPTNPLVLNSKRLISDYLGGKPGDIPAIYQAASPLLAVNRTTPPTLMIHGARDELVSDQHEERLSERLRQAGRPFYYLRLPWATHGCDINPHGPCGQLSTYALERFLACVLFQTPEERLAGLQPMGGTQG